MSRKVNFFIQTGEIWVWQFQTHWISEKHIRTFNWQVFLVTQVWPVRLIVYTRSNYVKKISVKKNRFPHDPKYTSLSVKHGGGSFMDWACMAASRTDSLMYINGVNHGDNSIMNSEVYSFCQFTENWIQMNQGELHAARQWTKTQYQQIKGLHQGKNWKV